jgi:hypothetical protein
MKIITIAIVLLYPAGHKLVWGQEFCSDNPFVSSRPSAGPPSVDCSDFDNEEADCWNHPDCIYFDSRTQLAPECADLPVNWPDLDQMVTVQVDPGVKYSCMPVSLSHNVLCYDSVSEYDDDEYAVLFGVEAGLDILGIELVLDLTNVMYKGTSIFPLYALAPDPLGTCMYKSLGNDMKIPVDPNQEHIVAIRLKKLPGVSGVSGDQVRLKISSLHDVWPTGDGNPYPVPKEHDCPRNWAEAIQTACTEEQVGMCMYEFRYLGCEYDELRCRPRYVCDCQPFFDKWRCWGDQELPNCPAGSRAASVQGEPCNRGDPLPQDPNPPPAVCPETFEDAVQHSCDGRVARCEYDFSWFGCFPGELVCMPNAACECNGQWQCNYMQHYCTDPERPRSTLVGSSCDPDECPPEAAVTGRACTTPQTVPCEYGFSYSGCTWSELSCEPIKTCQCNNGIWRCTMRSEPQCDKPPGFPEGPCNPNNPLPLPSK